MNPRSLLRWALLALVSISVAVYVLQRSGTQDPSPEPAAATADPATADPATPAAAPATVVVTYFTTDVRCTSCRTIESLAQRAVEEGFPGELARGEIVFRVINTDLPENQHYVEDYQLTNKTVIVSHQVDGRESEWTNRQDVWLLFHEPEKFMSYVREPVKLYLGKS
jgi:hypothetical protein